MKELIKTYIEQYPIHESLEVNLLAFIEWLNTQHKTDGTECWCKPRKEDFR